VVTGVVLLIALLVFGVVSKAPRTDIDERLGRGESAPAPGFELPVLRRGSLGPRLDTSLRSALADGRVALHELRGTPVVLNFWASWCGPCATEAPQIQAVSREYAGRTQVLGVAIQDRVANAKTFERDLGITYPSLFDPSVRIAAQFRGIAPAALPTTLVLDAEHRVAVRHFGAITADRLRTYLDSVLAEAAR
jgi:thiol-disulfide isomerase/thioredoxin